MNKKLLFATAVALLSASAVAQNVKVYDTGRKWDNVFDRLNEGQSVQRMAPRGLKSVSAQNLIDAEVSVSDAEVVASFVKEQGYDAEVITSALVVVKIPAAFVPVLGEREDVLYINAARQLQPFLSNARTETGVTKVQEGTGLETPYTGKGVVVGIIDQGFQYDHPAFKNRVVRWGAAATSGTLRTSAPAIDNYDDVGHATHVSNIAGGAKVSDCPYYGIATGSDMIQISSDFSTASVVRQAKAIKQYAEENGQPWVINMSFGGLLGPHDGTTAYDQSMDALTGPGGILVAAMGNEGGVKMHAMRTIETDDTPVYLYMKPDASNSQKGVMSEVWSTYNDGVAHLDIRPVVQAGGKLYVPDDTQLARLCDTGINPYNNRQYASILTTLAQLVQTLGVKGSTVNAYMMWQVKGKAGDSFHSWVYSSYPYECTFAAKGAPNAAKSGDDSYLVGEGAASIPSSVAVASYNNPVSYTSIDGGVYSFLSFVGKEGSISNFSSPGPQIVDTTVKPAVAAPGGVIISAFSKNAENFSATNYDVAQSVTVSGKKHYYGVMSGTSQASPMVTGIVALWLEANPKLTYDQLLEIFKKTSRRSNSQTGKPDENGWTATAGYGKIDAYEGLKEALKLAQQTGINETLNTEAPVTLQKGDDAWRVLFNNDESFAQVSLYTTAGALVKSDRLSSPRRGEEHVVSFGGLTPGVYLLKVATTASSLTRKVLVK